MKKLFFLVPALLTGCGTATVEPDFLTFFGTITIALSIGFFYVVLKILVHIGGEEVEDEWPNS